MSTAKLGILSVIWKTGDFVRYYSQPLSRGVFFMSREKRRSQKIPGLTEYVGL